MRKKGIITFTGNVLVLMLVLLSISAHSQMLPLSEQTLLSSSENIIKGKVISTQARWVNNNEAIYTFTKIVVDDELLGQYHRGDTVTIAVPGGYDPVSTIGMEVSHQAEFLAGEETIVFLNEARGQLDAIDYRFLQHEPGLPDKIMRVNGYYQGKRTIYFDKKTQTTMVTLPNQNKTIPLQNYQKQLTAELKKYQDEVQKK